MSQITRQQSARRKKSCFDVHTAAVIGSGVMGAGIAAHLANAGMKVLLLDIVPSSLLEEEARRGLALTNPQVRNRLALTAIAGMRKAKPAPLYDIDWTNRLTAGNLQDDLKKLDKVDWIIEAVVERLDVKREVLASIASVCRPDTVVSSNTSGLSVASMMEGLSLSFRQQFAVTHFFNPPRYMKLVEIIPAEEATVDTVHLLTELCERRLGKGVVIAKDTPNFIANRIGTYGMLVTLEAVSQYGLTIEEADALTGVAMGRPKSATFRLLDMVGLDTMQLVVDNVRMQSKDETEQRIFARPPVLEQLVMQGKLGSKSGTGFYRKLRGADGRSFIEVLRLDTMQYEAQRQVSSPVLSAVKSAQGTVAKTQALLGLGDSSTSHTDSQSVNQSVNPSVDLSESQHSHALFAWTTLKQTLLYAASLVGVIANSISDIDRAMRWGFAWELGPFELWDALGLETVVNRMRQDGDVIPAWIEAWLAEGHSSFYSAVHEKRFYTTIHGGLKEEQQEADAISLATLKAAGRTVLSTTGASLIDIGDDVVCLEFHSPNNAIGGDILAAIRQATEEVTNNWRGLVMANEGRNFCVGANLMLLLMEAQSGEWEEVEEIIRLFQSSMLLLRRLPRPFVAAPHRMTLGGGVEACLPADVIIASPETYFGLVETGVGLIPAGGGCKEAAMMAADRARVAAGGKRMTGAELQPQLNAMFETIVLAKSSTSGHEISRLGLLRPQDRVIQRQESRIAEAKRAVLALDEAGYCPMDEQRIAVAGREGKAVLQVGIQAMNRSGQISQHDAFIGTKLAHVLAGGDVRSGLEVSEQYLLDLECEAFLSLCGEQKTQQRMRHMLTTGKPLRN